MAVRLGVVNVERDILKGLTAQQFLRWELYSMFEPFGEERADYRAASIAAVIANVNRSKKQKPYKIEDFLLKFGEAEPKKKQTWQEQLAIMKLLAASYSTDPGPAVPEPVHDPGPPVDEGHIAELKQKLAMIEAMNAAKKG